MKVSEIVYRDLLMDEADAQSADQQRLRALKVNATRASAAQKQEASRQRLAKAQQDIVQARQTLSKAARPAG